MRAGLHAFVDDYLQHDGFFILRLIHSNVGDDITSTIVTGLWKNFQRTDKKPLPDNAAKANIGATVSLTATGNRGLQERPEVRVESAFDYAKAVTSL